MRRLDYVMAKARDLDLYLVLTLVNNWDAYGGMKWYVTNSPTATHHDDFYSDPWCRDEYRNHAATLINRTNTFTGVPYRDDPTLFAWQLANEPRVDWGAPTTPLTNWVWDMAAYIKSLDTNHMLSVGDEGLDLDAWTGNHQSPDVDYAVVQCWPDWWWSAESDATQYAWAMDYVATRLSIADTTLDMPFVLSEFGRMHEDWGGPPLGSPYGRNGFYRGWFDIIQASATNNGAAAGLHFWMLEAADSGHDDMVGSVFPSHTSTVAIVRSRARLFNAIIQPSFLAAGRQGSVFRLRWTDVVDSPDYRIAMSTNLATWMPGPLVTSNAWTDPGPPARRFYTVTPVY
jgi:mannan endo-1,4-beta-mannosidase